MARSETRLGRKSSCPACGYGCDSAGTVDGSERSPRPGSICICFKCGAVCKFGDDLALVPFTEAEIGELESDKDAMQYLAEITSALRSFYWLRERQT